jgi:hypothetical protein
MSEETNSLQRRKSRYVSGGVTESNPLALEWWERTVFSAAEDDRPYVVEKKFAGRLDLIAALFLGEPRMWWVIAQYNNVLDPFAELSEGALIYIPSTERVDALLNGKTGGIPSQREVPISILPII